MFDLSPIVDLPTVWATILAISAFLYVALDGFDLGVGILFPFAPDRHSRNLMINSIAPFWDSNETWLVMVGGGLFITFPLAYAILMPSLYLPIIFMLIGLIFRGVAFEFRHKCSKNALWIWDSSFHFGSLLAATMQGTILGNFVQGVTVSGRSFAGGPLDWANGFSLFVGIILNFGYTLLGSTWIVMKTTGKTQDWAKAAAKYSLTFVTAAIPAISLFMLFIRSEIFYRWFSIPNIIYLLPIPFLTILSIVLIIRDLNKSANDSRPFFLSILLFLLAYIGLGIGMWPWIVPFHFTIWEAAASTSSLSILLIGTIFLLPIILSYMCFSFYIFRGKVS